MFCYARRCVIWGLVGFCINTARDWNSFVWYIRTQRWIGSRASHTGLWAGHLRENNRVEFVYMFSVPLVKPFITPPRWNYSPKYGK
jgi:hypothetical protein